jgi:hypothetical protein
MNGPQDTDQAGIADEGGELNPRQAAMLVEETQMRARRQFEPSPMAAVVGAGVFLLGYGAVWLSMRDQHVYKGPAGWSIAVLYGLIAISAIGSRRFLRQATAGIGGRAHRQMQAQGVAVLAAGVAAWTVQGALRYHGVSYEVVYGVYGPTVPLIAIAAATTGLAASQGKWHELCLAIGIMLITAASTFFGPKGAWGLTGLGCCIALLVYAWVKTVWLRRPVPA